MKILKIEQALIMILGFYSFILERLWSVMYRIYDKEKEIMDLFDPQSITVSDPVPFINSNSYHLKQCKYYAV